MSIYFVSRHPGALDWARQQNIAVDRRLPHLDLAQIQPRDVVIGTLPVHLAAQLCERGARYLHLTLDLPESLRGQELSAEQMTACGARLQEFAVHKVAHSPSNSGG